MPNDLHQSILILLHNFVFGGRSANPYGNTFPDVWKTTDASNSAPMQDDGGDEVEVCALHFAARSIPPHFVVKGIICKENYCIWCIEMHTCGDKTIN